jgi:ATP-dependent helicase HrpB
LQPAAERLGFSLNPLHGDLSASEQQRAIEPAAQTKVILATNVAETSITIPGIAAVIDSGLARIAGHSPWSGFPTLATSRISKSSANQRAGRAGRTQAGLVLRLYTRQDFESRPENETPEIKRADLAETALLLHGAGIPDIRSFLWLEPPPDSAVEAAESLLVRLDAITEKGQITDLGRRMLRLPIHPRLSRLIWEGEKLQVAAESTLLAALLSERDIRLRLRTQLSERKSETRQYVSGHSDLLELLDSFREAEKANFDFERVRALGLDSRAVLAVQRGQRQLRRILHPARSAGTRTLSQNQIEEALLIAVLAAFPDRVAKRRRAHSRELVLAGGGSAVLSPASVVHEPVFIVAVDAEERRDAKSPNSTTPVIRIASAMEPEWLAGLFPQSISQKTDLVWNERAGRVDEVRQTSYGQVSLEETIRAAPPSEETSNILASAVLSRNPSPFRDIQSLPEFRARLALVSEHFPAENVPIITEQEIRDAVRISCSGRRSLDELAPLSLVDVLMNMLTDRQRALLRREVPDRIKLKSGRNVRVHYESEKSPWIESRLQDLFGTYATPRICAGRISLTVHLLAPNGRAVQVTKDLAGFWKRHYPGIRRELQRRYPKHSWPDPDKL